MHASVVPAQLRWRRGPDSEATGKYCDAIEWYLLMFVGENTPSRTNSSCCRPCAQESQCASSWPGFAAVLRRRCARARSRYSQGVQGLGTVTVNNDAVLLVAVAIWYLGGETIRTGSLLTSSCRVPAWVFVASRFPTGLSFDDQPL